jgi:hypothetical protein
VPKPLFELYDNFTRYGPMMASIYTHNAEQVRAALPSSAIWVRWRQRLQIGVGLVWYEEVRWPVASILTFAQSSLCAMVPVLKFV